jgi:GDP-L-fucose synthase
MDWAAARVIVTGGAGFLGRQVCGMLQQRGVRSANVFVPRRRDYDLTREADCARLYRDAFPTAKADLVIHLAAEVGGIGANRANPGR